MDGATQAKAATATRESKFIADRTGSRLGQSSPNVLQTQKAGEGVTEGSFDMEVRCWRTLRTGFLALLTRFATSNKGIATSNKALLLVARNY